MNNRRRRIHPGIRLFVLLAVLSGFSSISASAPTPPQSHQILGVPFVRQKRNNCGPASLSMVLGYYRVRIGQDELAAEIRPEGSRGTLNLDLLISARKHGFAAEMTAGGIAAVKEYLRRNIPVIAMVESSPKSDLYHYLVIHGYDDEDRRLIVHSGNNRDLSLPYRRFLAAWEAAGNWMLVVRRKDYP